jgi:hypothetical protein
VAFVGMVMVGSVEDGRGVLGLIRKVNIVFIFSSSLIGIILLLSFKKIDLYQTIREK